MPVIRGQAPVAEISAEERQKIAEQLSRELKGEQTPNGPVIFEIPLQQQREIDILVVWDALQPLSSIERSNLILEAYSGSSTLIAQALGVTFQEALEQQLLPYCVVPIVRRDEIANDVLKKAMLAEGGFTRENGKVELRFPTKSLAEQAHQRLIDALPQGYWTITQSIANIY